MHAMTEITKRSTEITQMVKQTFEIDLISHPGIQRFIRIANCMPRKQGFNRGFTGLWKLLKFDIALS